MLVSVSFGPKASIDRPFERDAGETDADRESFAAAEKNLRPARA
jgi:hypothetical protein